MAFASLQTDDGDDALAEINMVPMIDVMLVLLVIFIVAAPLLTHSVRLDLPQASATPSPSESTQINLALDANGQHFWNGEAQSIEALALKFAAAARQTPQPELVLSADRKTPYEAVAKTLAAAAQQGLTRIRFVTLPGEKS
ncbi:MAG: biopolymer transporter ExbD [Zoogloeaceae bacterium]|jgi:biopolymer transport protein ExbD|nr:biopolymer transporter ExbD [Zoogloeaceae bacterium]